MAQRLRSAAECTWCRITMVAEASATTFRHENVPLTEMVREWAFIRERNKTFNEGDDLSTCLLFAEGALVCMICEHFVRVVVEKNFPGESDGKELRALLNFAMTKERSLFKLPFEDQELGKKAVCDHRNALLHGNFAQAARQSGCASIEEYFRKRYTPEIEAMTKVVDFLMRQIDVTTGRPFPKRA